MSFKSLICAIALVFAPLAASAAVINPGDFVVKNNTLVAGTGTSYVFTAGSDLKVLDFVSVSSVGQNSSDLSLIEFGYTSSDIAGVMDTYDAGEISPNGGTSEANTTLSGFTLLAGQSFTFFFDYAASGASPVSNQFSFVVGAIPLPAGGLLLLTALGGLGFARRRKQAA